jgi:hypothetical protein
MSASAGRLSGRVAWAASCRRSPRGPTVCAIASTRATIPSRALASANVRATVANSPSRIVAHAASCASSAGRALAFSRASRVTRRGAWRMISSATIAPSEWPASANRSGAEASTVAAMPAIESSRSIRAMRTWATAVKSGATASHSDASPSIPGRSTSGSRRPRAAAARVPEAASRNASRIRFVDTYATACTPGRRTSASVFATVITGTFARAAAAITASISASGAWPSDIARSDAPISTAETPWTARIASAASTASRSSICTITQVSAAARRRWSSSDTSP